MNPRRRFDSRVSSAARRCVSASMPRDGDPFRVEGLESRTLLSVSLVGIPNWQAEGPAPQISAGNTVGPTTNTSVDVGAVQAVAVDPANNKHLLIGSVNGGVWQTNDFTVANPVWTTTTDQLPSLSIMSVGISPVNSNVMYAGTGNWSSLGVGENAVGIYKSADGGNSWTIMNPVTLASPNGIFVGLRIWRIVPTSLNGGNTIFLATNDTGFDNFSNPTGGVYRSDDGGTTWTRLSGSNGLPNAGVTDLVENPNNPNQFFVAIANSPSAGVYRLDLGVSTTWSNVSNNMTAGDLSASGRILLAVSPAGTNPVWADVINSSGFSQRVYRGVASGSTVNWSQVGPPSGGVNLPPDVYGPNNQGGLHGSIAADPSADNLVYIAGDTTNVGAVSATLARGDSTANTWTSIVIPGGPVHPGTTVVPTSNGDTTAPHSDSRAMAFAAGGVLLDASDGGIYQGTNPASTVPGSQTWTGIIGNLQISEMYAIAYDSVANIIFGGDQDTGNPDQTATGSFTYFDEAGGDGGATAADNFTGAGTGQSVRYFFGAVRKLYTGGVTRVAGDHDANILPSGGLTGMTNSSPNDLFINSFINNIAPTNAQLLAGQSTRVVVTGRTGGTITTGAVYESNDAGSGTLTNIAGKWFVNDTWTQIPTGPGFSSASVIAYGGRSGGVDNPDVLYAGSGNRIFLRTTSGGTLTATSGQPAGAGTIAAIALDPNDWHTAFVSDGFRVWMTTNSGGSWTNITGNLNNTSPFNTGLAVIPGAGDNALIFGGDNGVYRMLTSNPGQWVRFGAGLPNSITGGMVYNAVDDVLVEGTVGRGAWEIASAGTDAFTTPTLQVDGTNGDDVIKLIIDANNPLLLDVFVNSATPTAQIPVALLSQINVNGLAGNDLLIVDESNGLISMTNGIHYDGGTGFDSMTLQGGSFFTETALATGPGAGSVSFGGTTISYTNLSPVNDTVGATNYLFSATAGADLINVVDGPVVSGQQTTQINSGNATFELTNIADKANVAVNGLGGNDVLTVNNPNPAVGMARLILNGGPDDDTFNVTGSTTVPIAVDGGTQVTGDTLNVEGQSLTYTLSGTAFTIATLQPITYQNVETLGLADGTFNSTGTISPAVVVGAGATLAGAGSIVGPVTSNAGGTVAPGVGLGNTAIINTGNLTLNAASTFAVDINGETPGTQYDQLVVTGNVVLNAPALTATVTVSTVPGDAIVIIDNPGAGSVTGNFLGLPQGAVLTLGTQQFTIDYTYDSEGDGLDNDVALVRFGAALAQDPCDPTQQALFVSATAGPDNIQIVPYTGSSSMQVFINGASQGVFAPTGHLIVFGQSGDDLINVTVPQVSAYLYGGNGNDTIRSGNGDSFLIGGDGNDSLYAGNGKDILIGGRGSDSVVGGNSNDILIAGRTSYDGNSQANRLALCNIMDEWSHGSTASSVTNIFNGGGRNGSSVFNSTTVFNDASPDTLLGGNGKDWFLINTFGNDFTDVAKNEIVTVI